MNCNNPVVRYIARLKIPAKLRITAISLCLFNTLMLIVLNALSKHAISMMVVLGVIQVIVTATGQLVRMNSLLNYDERPAKIFFVFFLLLILFWLIQVLVAFVYFSKMAQGAAVKNLSFLVFQRFSLQTDMALNQLYFFPMFLLNCLYIRFWYRFFWVQYVSVIFNWIKNDMSKKNELLQLRLDSLETHIGRDRHDWICSMCLQGDIGLNIVKIDCGHSYHRECLKVWVTRHPNCPLCRNPFKI